MLRIPWYSGKVTTKKKKEEEKKAIVKCYVFQAKAKNVYLDKLDYLVHRYNNTYHRTIKIKAVNVKASPSFDFDVENNDKDPKLEVDNYVRISKYKNIFWKIYYSKWSKEVFVIKRVKNTV